MFEAISIHAPREGSDAGGPGARAADARISIHAPREGSDPSPAAALVVGGEFLSTLPVRGATIYNYVLLWFEAFLSTLPVRGATLLCDGGLALDVRFLSTLPVRGATVFLCRACYLLIRISIHAPREGSDHFLSLPWFCNNAFLSTLPVRGATTGGGTAHVRPSDFYPRSP